MTRQDAEKLAIKLGLSSWDMGDDGFGGEDVPNANAVKLLMEYELKTDASTAEGPTLDTGIRCVYGEKAPSHGCACCNCEGVKELLAKLAAEGPKPGPRCPKCESEGIFTSIRTDQFPHGLEVKCADCKQVLPIRDIADFAQFFPARAEGDMK